MEGDLGPSVPLQPQRALVRSRGEVVAEEKFLEW